MITSSCTFLQRQLHLLVQLLGFQLSYKMHGIFSIENRFDPSSLGDFALPRLNKTSFKGFIEELLVGS